MISVKAAKLKLVKACTRYSAIKMAAAKSAGMVLAQPVVAAISVPSFDNSAMDGYAFAYEDSRESWKVVATIPAGFSESIQLKAGEAARIFTGSPIPKGADTVVPQEHVAIQNDIITIPIGSLSKGANVRYCGLQAKEGDTVMETGMLITPGGVGLAASVGVSAVEVYACPRVSVIVTGSELQEAGESLNYGSIYNSNGPMLTASLSAMGVTAQKVEAITDNKELLQKSITDALESSDMLIISGGISVGDYDFVRPILQHLGVVELFYKLKQRPGKPVYAGMYGNTQVFALPGNPASVLTCFNQFVKPVLRYGMGHDNVWKPDATLPLASSFWKKKGYTFFMKAFHRDGKIYLLEGQESFNLRAFATANCFVEIEEDVQFVDGGETVNVYWI